MKMMVLLGVFVMSLLWHTSIVALAQTIPDHTEFTADRMVCESKKLDYKSIYGHKPNTDEGITTHIRPSLEITLIHYYIGSKLEQTYLDLPDKLAKAFFKAHPQFTEEELNRFLELYLPDGLLEKCKKNQKAR